MKKIFVYGLFPAIVLLALSSCRKYVEIEPQQVKVLKATSDYEQLLNYRNVMDAGWYYPQFSGDDVESRDDVSWQNALESTTSVYLGAAYAWKADYFGADEEDNQWANLYKEVYYCNLVTDGVLSSQGGTDDQKKAVYSAALVHRAFCFLSLVNMYARQYDPATAATEPGIPLQTEITIDNSLKRATVKQVYDRIVSDLKEAVPNLTGSSSYAVTTASKAGAYAMLARTYQNMRDFTAAEAYADSALAIRGTLLDLNNYKGTAVSSFPKWLDNPEVILLKKVQTFKSTIPVSRSLLSLMGTNDLRYQIFTVRSDSAGFAVNTERGYYGHKRASDGFMTQVGPTVPEMMLIKAESEARAGRTSQAVGILNNLRRKRFTPGNYADLSASTPAEALQLVINERRFELFCTGMRWFDMRRYDIDGLTGTISKYYKGETFTITHGSNRYMYPIAPKYIRLNPEIEQNPR